MSGPPPVLAVLATMDTKAAEARYLAERLQPSGMAIRLVDVGLHVSGGDGGRGSDVTADEVASAAGATVEALHASGRAIAMETMTVGSAVVLGRWLDERALAGVIAVGGNQGTSIAAGAMRGLPYGIPKIVVSTVASGNVRPYVADSDITMMFSIGDLLGGPNEVTEPVLRRAAGALLGMVSANEPPAALPAEAAVARPVAITAFGNTHAAVSAAIAHLEARGRRAVVFHASGACGSAMERLIDDGVFDAVLDLTTHELLGELYPADIYAPVRPGRLTAAGRAGIPQVVAPGGLHYHCFGGPSSIPRELRGRPVHHHNPQNTNVRASADELEHVAAVMAERLNDAHGPAAVLVPTQGWSEVGGPGGPLHDPAADARFVRALADRLTPQVALREYPLSINDPDFAAAAVDTLETMLALAAPPAASLKGCDVA